VTTPVLQDYFARQAVEPQRAVMVIDGTALLHRLYFVFSRRRRPWWNAVEERLRELKRAEDKAARVPPLADASVAPGKGKRRDTGQPEKFKTCRGRPLANPADAAAAAEKRGAMVAALLAAERERLGASVADAMSERDLLLSAAGHQVGRRGLAGDPTFFLQQALGRFVSAVRRLVPPGVVPAQAETDGERLGLLRRVPGQQPLGVLADPQFLTERQRYALAAWRAKTPVPHAKDAQENDLISLPPTPVPVGSTGADATGKTPTRKTRRKDKQRRSVKQPALSRRAPIRDGFIASLMGDHPEVLVEVAGDGVARQRSCADASPFLQRRVIFCFDVHTIFTPHRVELPYQRRAIVPAYKGQRFRSPFIAPFMAIAVRVLRNMAAHGDIDACLPDTSFDGIAGADGTRYGVEADDLLLSCVRYYCQPEHPHQRGAAVAQFDEAVQDGIEPAAPALAAVAPAVGWAQQRPHVVVLSHDKDLFQLLQYPRTHFYHFGYKRFVSPRDVATRYSGAGWAASAFAPDAWRAVPPTIADSAPCDADVVARERVRQLNDYLTICGDVADNVDGFPGVGTATALRLLVRYGGVHGLLDAAARFTASTSKTPEGTEGAGAAAPPPVRMERELLLWAAPRRKQILQSYSEVVGLLEVPGTDARLADVEQRALVRRTTSSPGAGRNELLPSWPVEVARTISECFQRPKK
jgi:hypothetical protein